MATQKLEKPFLTTMSVTDAVHSVVRQIAALDGTKMYAVVDRIALPALQKHLAKLKKAKSK